MWKRHIRLTSDWLTKPNKTLAGMNSFYTLRCVYCPISDFWELQCIRYEESKQCSNVLNFRDGENNPCDVTVMSSGLCTRLKAWNLSRESTHGKIGARTLNELWRQECLPSRKGLMKNTIQLHYGNCRTLFFCWFVLESVYLSVLDQCCSVKVEYSELAVFRRWSVLIRKQPPCFRGFMSFIRLVVSSAYGCVP